MYCFLNNAAAKFKCGLHCGNRQTTRAAQNCRSIGGSACMSVRPWRCPLAKPRAPSAGLRHSGDIDRRQLRAGARTVEQSRSAAASLLLRSSLTEARNGQPETSDSRGHRRPETSDSNKRFREARRKGEKKKREDNQLSVTRRCRTFCEFL